MLLFLGAVACLAIWLVFTFLVPAGLGVVHVLLGVGVALLIRWWVLARPRPVS
jgi:hypothetical protein